MRTKKIFLFTVLTGIIILFFTVHKKGEEKVFSSPLTIVSYGSIPKGGTIYSCLIKEGLSNKEVWQITKTLKKVFNVCKCAANDKYEVVKTSEGIFERFKYYSGLNIYEVNKNSSGELVALGKKISLKKSVLGISGEIKTTLWSAMYEKEVSAETILEFVDIFAWQIDFLTETRRGDTYSLVWEKYTNGEKNKGKSKILIARYCGEETKKHNAVSFKDGYYDLKGRSLQKQFLRAPLNYRRISSYFSRRRFHPILRYWRPHLGIDYAAPIGTPVASIGDGTVIFKGRKGGYGRFIKIRHNSVYITTYGHLWRYAKKIRKGTKVKQGQVIGYVGSSGLSTGPHLDFRMIKNGKCVNFLRLKFPSKKKISLNHRAEFNRLKKARLRQVALVLGHTVSPKGLDLFSKK